ncbi:MAG: AAA family ATPase, partial [bacterium]|nr:AAA family ATPase [bacterium]
MQKRYLSEAITADLKEKMVFLGGPRQVGKTTFGRKTIAAHYRQPAYFNWDYRPDRQDILNFTWPAEADLLFFDEIHKYKKWKNLVKGLYDKHRDDFDILVTGSARLDLYRRGGDSLQGRYHYYRLHPFSLAEASGRSGQQKPGSPLTFSPNKSDVNILKQLLAFGGFPEPFIAQNEKRLRRWRNERLERLFREDIRDTEIIRDLSSMELLADLLPTKAAGQLSINTLREDLEVSHKAVKRWLDLLERFYYHFRIYPFAGRKIRSLKKEPKLYL